MPPIKIDHAKLAELINSQTSLLESKAEDSEKEDAARNLISEFAKVGVAHDEKLDALVKVDPDPEDDEEDEEGKAASKPATPVTIEQKMDLKSIFEKAKSFSHLKYDDQHDTITVMRDFDVCRGTFGDIKSMSATSVKSEKSSEEGGDDFRPTDKELELINSFTKKSFPKEALKVYYTKSADMNLDAHYEHFSKKGLKDMADLSPGKPVIKDHATYNSDGAFGKIFDAKVAKDDGDGHYLMQKFFLLDDADNASIIKGIESGINDKLSVGITLNRAEYLCDVCNKAMFGKSGSWGDWCGHYPGYKVGDGDDAKIATATINRVANFRELSRVTSPAQGKAQINPKAKSLVGVTESEEEKLLKFAQLDLSAKSDSPKPEKDSATLSTEPKNNSSEVAKVDWEKLIEAQNKQIESQNKMIDQVGQLISKQQETIDSMAAYVKATEASSKDWQNELKSELGLLKDTVKERSETLQILLKSTINFQETTKQFADQCGIAVKKSTHDIALEQATQKDMGRTRIDAESSAAKGEEFYGALSAGIGSAAAEK